MAEARCRPRGPAFESAAAEALKLREEEPRSPVLARFWDVLVSKADGNRCQTIFRASPRHKIDEQDIGVFSGAVAPIQRARGVLFCDVPVSSAEIGALNETGSLRVHLIDEPNAFVVNDLTRPLEVPTCLTTNLLHWMIRA
jgi:hypothetical protein